MSTQVTSVAVVNSTVDSTPIGQTTPSTAQFTNPANGDDSQAAATTHWVRSLGFAPGSGSVTLPGGLILKWGTTGGANPQTVTFSPAFPNALFGVFLTSNDFGTGATRNVAYITSQFTTGFSCQTDSSSIAVNWLAIGN